MSKVYAVANQKGGVGKTTTTVNLAACIAEAGHRTLLIDIDPQANATVGLGFEKTLEPNTYDLFCREKSLIELVRAATIKNLDILPSSADLTAANLELPREDGSETILREALLSARDKYSYLFIDCPPSLGPLTINALAAADRLIVPVQAEYFALEGLADLFTTVDVVQRTLNPKLAIAGVLITMYDSRTRLSRDVEKELKTYFPSLLFDTVVPRNTRVGESPSFGKPVIHHDPQSAGANAYFALAREVVQRHER